MSKRKDETPILPMCRICGSEFNLIHVLQGGQELLEKLWVCANIKIDFEGNLPKHLCRSCEQGLNFSYRLRKQGEAMELRLRQNEVAEIDLNAEVSDVEDALQQFRVSNSVQSKTKEGGEVQIINVEDIMNPNPSGINNTKSMNVAKANQTTNNSNSNFTVSKLIPNENISAVVDLELEDSEEFVHLEKEVQKTVEHSSIFSAHEAQDDDVEIIEEIPALSESGINKECFVFSAQALDNDVEIIEEIPVLSEHETSTFYQTCAESNTEIQQESDDDIEIIATYPPLNSDTSVKNSEILTQTSNFDLQKHIAEYLERSRPVKVQIVNRAESLQRQSVRENKTIMQDSHSQAKSIQVSDIVVQSIPIDDIVEESLKKQSKPIMQDSHSKFSSMQVSDIVAQNIPILHGTLDDITHVDDDIIEECYNYKEFDEYGGDEFSKGNFEFETLQKYSIELAEGINSVEDMQHKMTDSDVGKNTPPQNITTALDIYNCFKCDTCGEVFCKQSDYRFHIKMHGSERYNCSECNKWFPTRYRLKQHERTHTNDVDTYNCLLCENTYRHRQNLKRHMITAHADGKTFNCDQCNEVFTRPDILKNHMSKHTLERNFTCEMCSKSFKSNFYLMSHKRSHQRKANKSSARDSYSATTNTGTSTSDESSNPTQNNGNKRTYYCAHCGKISKHLFTHKNHLRTHSLELPYDCEYCKKKFRTMAARITHERIHSDDRPYQCQRCYVSFRQSSHLKEHMLIHDGIMSHVCNICNMAFTKKSNMKVHMRIHTGERPYKCAEIDCEKQFAKLAQLKRHAKQAHSRNVDILANDEDDDLSSGNELENEEGSDHFESEELDVGIGAEEIAVELVNDLHYNSLYIFDEIGTS